MLAVAALSTSAHSLATWLQARAVVPIAKAAWERDGEYVGVVDIGSRSEPVFGVPAVIVPPIKGIRRFIQHISTFSTEALILETSTPGKLAWGTNFLIRVYENLAKGLIYIRDVWLTMLVAGHIFSWPGKRTMSLDKGWNLGHAKGAPKPTGVGLGLFQRRRAREGTCE